MSSVIKYLIQKRYFRVVEQETASLSQEGSGAEAEAINGSEVSQR